MHGHIAFTEAGDLMHDSVKERPAFQQDQGLLALNKNGSEKTDTETALDSTICSCQITCSSFCISYLPLAQCYKMIRITQT